MGLHPSMGTLVTRGSGLALVLKVCMKNAALEKNVWVRWRHEEHATYDWIEKSSMLFPVHMGAVQGREDHQFWHIFQQFERNAWIMSEKGEYALVKLTWLYTADETL